jgi:hypothetical protein
VIRKIRKKINLASILLILGTFFNPLGFDVVFALVLSSINSYWITCLIFYLISAFCFGLYYYYIPRKYILMLGMFFNPFGFDVAFASVMSITGSYWITDAIFYLISISFYISYYITYKNESKKVSGVH